MVKIVRFALITALFLGLSDLHAQNAPCEEGKDYTVSTHTLAGIPQVVVSFKNTTARCVWVKPAGVNSFEYVVIGGGGAGGSGSDNDNGCGGGGAGAFVQGTYTANSDTLRFNILVGAGGAAISNGLGSNGSTTSLSRSGVSNALWKAAIGGGGGGTFSNPGLIGASSGGGGGREGDGSVSPLSPLTGKIGGVAYTGGAGTAAGGGGGGFTQAGGNAVLSGSIRLAGKGGDGIGHSITGSLIYYAGGGGGGSTSQFGQGSGGIGGGGSGAWKGDAEDGLDGTGGGGGGASTQGLGGDGGDGAVIIRYAAVPCFAGVDYLEKVIISEGNMYKLLTFQNVGVPCTWVVPNGVTSTEYLVVGGGGSGNTILGTSDWDGGGGGGAGGLLTGSYSNLSAGSALLVKPGAGATAPTSAASGVNGENSFLSLENGTNAVVAIGGGGGGKFKIQGGSGGSGGGGGGRVSTAGGLGTSSQGFSGGTARGNDDAGRVAGGGGGGAGGVGANGASNSSTAGAGGPGLANSITGENVFYAGGGGGGAHDEFGGEIPGAGGNGGGGAGSGSNGNAGDGIDGLGGGGGGVGRNGIGGDGGDGTVIIRYNESIEIATTTASGVGISNEGSGLFTSAGLNVDAGKTLTIQPGVTLVVEGDLVNNGLIVLKSNPTGTSYGQLKWSGNYTGTGNITVEKYLSAEWNLLSVGASGVGPTYFGAVSNDNTKPWEANLYEWSGTNFTPVYSNGTVSAQKGYLAYVGALGVHTSSGVKEFTGTPQTEMNYSDALFSNATSAMGTVEMYGQGPLDGGALDRKGWNLLANPFTADLRVFELTRSNLANSYYLRNASGGYTAVSQAGIEPDVVPPLSAFWVKASTNFAPTVNNGTSGKVTFNTTLKAPTFSPITSDRNMLSRQNNYTNIWNKSFVRVSADVLTKGERASVTEKGFVYSKTDQTPTLEESASSVASGANTGTMTSYLTGLDAGSTYYVRPYAKSPSGTAYGVVLTVTTPSVFTCGENISFNYIGSSVTYGTVFSNSECWMTRNLGGTVNISGRQTLTSFQNSHYFQWGRKADGHQIPTSATSSAKIKSDAVSSSFITNVEWNTTNDRNLWQGVFGANNPCPTNWRIPKGSEWETEFNSWTSTSSLSSGLKLATYAYNSSLGLSASNYRSETNGSRTTSPNFGDGLFSLYWSSTVGANGVTSLQFNNDGPVGTSGNDVVRVQTYNSNYGRGYFVRCILTDGFLSGSFD